MTKREHLARIHPDAFPIGSAEARRSLQRAIALGAGGRPLPFRDTMRGFGKSKDLVTSMRDR